MRAVSDFLALVTPYQSTRPKYMAMLAAVLQPFVSARDFIASIPSYFDLDQAIGAQLDVLGQWIGRSRKIPEPVQGAYFSFDITGLGFDQAVWAGPYSSTSAVVALDDTTYLALLRAKIAVNESDGTTTTMASIYKTFFSQLGASASTLLFVEDKADGSYVVGLSGAIPALLYLVLFNDDSFLPLKPAGIIRYALVTTVNNTSMFGFDVSNAYLGGFNVGSWGAPPVV